jgi:hypothetical protein
MDMRGALAANADNGYIYTLIGANDRPVGPGIQVHSSDCNTGSAQ